MGPENFTYRELLDLLCQAMKIRRLILPAPRRLAYAGVWLTGKLVGEPITTWPEVGAMMDGLLSTDSPPAGQTRLSQYLRDNAERLGRRFQSDRRGHAGKCAVKRLKASE